MFSLPLTSFSVSSFLGTFLASLLFLGALYVISRRRRQIYEAQPRKGTLQNELVISGEKSFEYPDELRSFLTSIKVFGYMEEPVFFEIIKAVQTLKIKTGETLQDLDQALYIVNTGSFTVYAGEERKDEHAIYQVGPKNTILSLYNILSVVCECPLPSCHVIAEATTDSDVIKLPLEAFKKLNEQFPVSVNQLIQVAITRFQRISFLTLNRYFGLTSELMKSEIGVSKEPTSPRTFFQSLVEMEEQELHEFVANKLAEFVGLDESLSVSDLIKYQIYDEGDVLVELNDAGVGVIVVIEGELEASMLNPNEGRRVAELVYPGSVAGHWTFLTGCPSLLEIKAKTSCRVATMTKASFDTLMERNPKLWAKVARKMLQQLHPLVRQVDFALEWVHITAGQVLFSQGDEGNDFYLVLNGRLRSLVKGKRGEVEIEAEYTQGDAIGEISTITETPRMSTVHAVRDTELARLPRHLFYFLALRYPQAMIQISKNIAAKSHAAMSSTRPEISRIRTIAILPISTSDSIPIDLFAQGLLLELSHIGASILIDNSVVLQQLGKNAFNPVGDLKLSSWLEEQEEKNRVVLYKADQVGTPWTQRCIRQADCILLLAPSHLDIAEGDIERFLKASKNTVRKELVLLHSHGGLAPGTTYKWLKNRPHIVMHHHVLMSLSNMGLKRQNTSYAFRNLSSSPNPPASDNKDIARLARYITRRSVAVVLGGGGARGMAHIGFLRALEESGIPVDMIGGTSIGAFVGGLYARDVNTVPVLSWAKKFCVKMSSTWQMAWDLTYPVAAWFSGAAFNRNLKKIYSDHQIEDLWLNYFCVTANISKSTLEVHQTGTLWRYVRASMSLSGFLPPLCDQGDMLVDGGYLNNLPVDIMKKISGARRVIAIDVAVSDDPGPINYGDSLSGWWVILTSWNPFASRVKYPTIADIQSRLAYVSSHQRLEEVKKIDGCLYLQPPIQGFGLMEFHRHKEIVDVGYKFGLETVEKWRKEGIFSEFLQSDSKPHLKRRYSR